MGLRTNLLITVAAAVLALAGAVCAAPGDSLAPETRRAIENDWLMQEKVSRGLDAGTRQAVEGAIARGLAMADDLGSDAARAELKSIAAEANALGEAPAGENWLGLYLRTRWIVRKLALSNPAIDFNQILFVKRNWPYINHQCSHRVGEAQLPPANLCVLTGLKGDGKVREILTGDMAAGGIGRPDLSFNARRIVFPYAAPRRPATNYAYGVHGVRAGQCYCYDVWEVNLDGSGLHQMTDTPNVEDTEPCYLPDGRIAFTTSREGRYVQCGDWALVCGIYSMNRDGSDQRKVTEAQEGEFYPSVLSDGRILYTRWDYIMKGYNVIQQLWTVNPDGTRAQLAYGDWYSFSPGPIALDEARQIPGTNKVIATGAAHHNTCVGPVMIADLSQNRMGPAGMVNVTPEVGFPECNAIPIDERTCTPPSAPPMSNVDSPTGWYSSPYPLTEKQYLACASFERSSTDPDAFAIYLMDVHGNKDLIYRGEGFSCYSPIPIRPRPVPRVMPDAVRKVDPKIPGRLVLYNVYEGLDGVKPGTVKYLRVLEAHPKLAHTVPQRLDFGLNSGWDQRSILGTVPVEADGSAFFTVPSGKMVFFQALDKDHLQVRGMRNYMNLMPGESVSCVGCHEAPGTVPPADTTKVLALRRQPSKITQSVWGHETISFARDVQPTLNRRCISCHDGSGAEGKSFDLREGRMVQAPTGYDADEGPQHLVSSSFLNLLPHVSYVRVGGYQGEKLPLKPYTTGSGASKLMQMLAKGHNGVKLTPVEWQALAAWIDCNATYYGDWSEISTRGAFSVGSPGDEDRKSAVERRAAIQKDARLLAYLNCGMDEKDGAKGGPVISQTIGSYYDYPAKLPDLPAAWRVISFDPQEIKFTVTGLKSGRTYTLGLTWWDYDAGGRLQSVVAKNCGTGKLFTLVDKAPLPSYTDRKMLPESRRVKLPPELTSRGDIELYIRRDSGANAVVSEIWLEE